MKRLAAIAGLLVLLAVAVAVGAAIEASLPSNDQESIVTALAGATPTPDYCQGGRNAMVVTVTGPDAIAICRTLVADGRIVPQWATSPMFDTSPPGNTVVCQDWWPDTTDVLVTERTPLSDSNGAALCAALAKSAGVTVLR